MTNCFIVEPTLTEYANITDIAYYARCAPAIECPVSVTVGIMSWRRKSHFVGGSVQGPLFELAPCWKRRFGTVFQRRERSCALELASLPSVRLAYITQSSVGLQLSNPPDLPSAAHWPAHSPTPTSSLRGSDPHRSCVLQKSSDQRRHPITLEEMKSPSASLEAMSRPAASPYLLGEPSDVDIKGDHPAWKDGDFSLVSSDGWRFRVRGSALRWAT